MRVAKYLAFLAMLLSMGFHPGWSLAATPQWGVQYVPVDPPQPTETGKKIEVLEIFWYGCPHCFELEPIINAWAKNLPPDVAFRRMPAVFRDDWMPAAKAFYAFKALGLLEKLHDPFFNAIHLQGLDVTNDNAIFDWVAKQGVDRKKFVQMYNSFTVQSEAMRAKQLTQAYGVTGVPSVVVNGRYLTSSAMAGSHQALPGVIDYLIAQVRKEQAGSK